MHPRPSRFIRRVLGVVGLATLVACSGLGCGTSSPSADEHSQQQGDPLAIALERDTGVRWSVMRDERGRAVIALPAGDAKPLVPQGASVEEAALDFFHRYAPLLGATDADAPSVAEVRTDNDEGALRHVILAQSVSHGGGQLPIWDSGASVHVTPKGALAWVEPTFVGELDKVPTSPTISESDAAGRARAAATNADSSFVVTSVQTPTLGVLAGDDGLHLVWSVTVVSSMALSITVFVDAMGGAIRDTRDALHRAAATAFTAKHYLPDPTDEKKTFNVEPITWGDWDMRDPAMGITVQSFITELGFGHIGETIHGDIMSDAWDATGKRGEGSAVDAYANTTQAATWFRKTFEHYAVKPSNRLAHLRVMVHRSGMMGGGAFSALDDTLMFDDFIGSSIVPPAVALDVVLHEYTHAVVHTTVNPLAPRILVGDQAKPLNESLADIFAAIAEHDLHPSPTNLLFGEEVAGSGFIAIHDHLHPSSREVKQPQVDIYHEGIDALIDGKGTDPHTLAGIPTKAWSLMTFGGSFNGVDVPGALGWEKGRDLWWKTIQSLTQNFSGWRIPRVAVRQIGQAAQGFKNSRAGIETVACAWLAVGALDKKADADAVTTALKFTPNCFTARVKPPHPITKGSCTDRPDGWVCNSSVSYSAILCKGGVFTHSRSCPDMHQRCKKASSDDPTASLDPISQDLICE